MRTVLDLIVAAIVAYVAYNFITEYAKATGTTWQRLLSSAQGSATILWQKFVIVVTGVTGALVYCADFVGEPGVGDAIKGALQPEYVALASIAIAFISWWARKRTLQGG